MKQLSSSYKPGEGAKVKGSEARPTEREPTVKGESTQYLYCEKHKKVT